MKLQAPFPYYGCKNSISKIVWNAFGNPKIYLEPFFGSGAILLTRPNLSNNSIEIINDLDGHVTNVWRCLKLNPDSLIKYCDWPISHLDLIARKKYLLKIKNSLEESLKNDLEFSDPKAASIWIWYACTSICGDMTSRNSLPNLMSNSGIHKITARSTTLLFDWFSQLSKRLRYVKIVCSNWSSICGNWLDQEKSIAIFLDPPYLGSEKTYYTSSKNLSNEVREYCYEKGQLPNYKIILCGYDEHQELMNYGWTSINWKAKGWFSKNDNRFKERIYFSPACSNSLLIT